MLVERMNVQLKIEPNELGYYLSQGFKEVKQEKKETVTTNRKTRKTK